MGHVREKPRGHPRGKGFGGEGSRLTFVSLTFAWASRRISTQPSYPHHEDLMSAVPPYLWGDESSEGGRLQQELAGGRRAQQARRGRVCKARRAGGAAASQRRRGSSQGCGRSIQRRNDAGAHARRMRRRTEGLCQLTLPPRPISRLSSGSLLPSAASYTALPIASLIAPAALYAPARTPADSGGHARLG